MFHCCWNFLLHFGKNRLIVQCYYSLGEKIRYSALGHRNVTRLPKITSININTSQRTGYFKHLASSAKRLCRPISANLYYILKTRECGGYTFSIWVKSLYVGQEADRSIINSTG